MPTNIKAVARSIAKHADCAEDDLESVTAFIENDLENLEESQKEDILRDLISSSYDADSIEHNAPEEVLGDERVSDRLLIMHLQFPNTDHEALVAVLVNLSDTIDEVVAVTKPTERNEESYFDLFVNFSPVIEWISSRTEAEVESDKLELLSRGEGCSSQEIDRLTMNLFPESTRKEVDQALQELLNNALTTKKYKFRPFFGNKHHASPLPQLGSAFRMLSKRDKRDETERAVSELVNFN